MYVCMYVCVWSQGRCYVYSMHGITYRVVADDDGLFNGSDEFACKADNLPYHTIPYPTLPCVTTLSSPEQAAGNERRAALEFMQLGGLGLGLLPKMHVPLTCTVDVMGARVLCVAKQPVQAVRPHPPPYPVTFPLSCGPRNRSCSPRRARCARCRRTWCTASWKRAASSLTGRGDMQQLSVWESQPDLTATV